MVPMCSKACILYGVVNRLYVVGAVSFLDVFETHWHSYTHLANATDREKGEKFSPMQMYVIRRTLTIQCEVTSTTFTHT